MIIRKEYYHYILLSYGSRSGWNGLRVLVLPIYIASDNSFYIPEELDADIEENVMNENRTIEYICQYARKYFVG